MALIKHFFAELGGTEHVQMARRLLGKTKTKLGLGDATELKPLLPALRLLADEPDAKAFEELEVEVADHHRQECIIKRFGLSRAAAENATPMAIKLLKPKVRGCTIVWQATESTFSARTQSLASPVKLASKRRRSMALDEAMVVASGHSCKRFST